MKKILLLTLIVTVSLMSCKNDQKKAEEKETVKVEEVDNTEKIEKIFGQFKSLYSELIEFKGKDDFKKFGFGQGGPYNKWLKEVEQLENDPDSKLLLQKGVVTGELKSLGMEYASSKGQETEVTKSFNKIFADAINSKPFEEVETASGNSNYDMLKTDYELFGKWEITNSMSKTQYPYEIYKKGNEYIGVIPQGDYKTEILDKKGDKYSVKGNTYGEYYKIDGNKNMTLFDKDGELASMGYKATKK